MKPDSEPRPPRAGRLVVDFAAGGRYHFTAAEMRELLGVSPAAARLALSRLANKGLIASPARGFYVVVPPEYRRLGCLPAEHFVPAFMAHLNRRYYAALLSGRPVHTVPRTIARKRSRWLWPGIAGQSPAAGSRSPSSPASASARFLSKLSTRPGERSRYRVWKQRRLIWSATRNASEDWIRRRRSSPNSPSAFIRIGSPQQHGRRLFPGHSASDTCSTSSARRTRRRPSSATCGAVRATRLCSCRAAPTTADCRVTTGGDCASTPKSRSSRDPARLRHRMASASPPNYGRCISARRAACPYCGSPRFTGSGSTSLTAQSPEWWSATKMWSL